VCSITLEQLFHLMGQLFAINFHIDFIISHGTQPVKVGGSYSRPFPVDRTCFSVEHILISKNMYACMQTFYEKPSCQPVNNYMVRNPWNDYLNVYSTTSGSFQRI